MTPVTGAVSDFLPEFLFWLVFATLLYTLCFFAQYTASVKTKQNKKSLELKNSTFNVTNFSN